MAGRHKGTPKTGGRKPGSVNKATRLGGAEYVSRVFSELHADKQLTPERLSVLLLTCGQPQIIQKELQALREYQYGKSPQSLQIGGDKDAPIQVKVIIEHVGASTGSPRTVAA